MRLIDTHTHLYAPQFDKDREEMMARAVAAGVEQFYLPNIDHSSIAGMLALENQYPDRCFAMMGLHPCSVKEDYEQELAVVKEWLDKRSWCAIGEIGIDLYWDTTFVEEQKKAFLQQVAWAKAMELPIVIHSRESIDMILELLEPEQDDRLRGIFHCFTGTVEQAQRIIDLGFLMGIGGVLTFKKAGLDKTLTEIDLQHLVLETDSPYLAPAPFRGKRNESAYVKLVAERLAVAKSTTIEEVAKITSANAAQLFVTTVARESK